MICLLFLSNAALTANAQQDLAPLKGKSYGKGQKFTIVFLHGDVSGAGEKPANYYARFMSYIAARAPESTAIDMLRPGYANGSGLVSPGTNHKRRDQYTATNNDLVAETLKSLRVSNPDAKLIVVGHSGGAAQLGAVIGRYPGIVDTAILLAFTCDIKKWRAKYRPFPRSEKQSPIKFASTIGPDTKVIAITGARDKNTWSDLAKSYVDIAQKNGTDAILLEVAGVGHWDQQLEGYVARVMLEEAK